MFKNLEELKQEILSGKTNKQIIDERLAYLISEEYKSARQETKKRPGTSQVSFYDGFINDKELIAFNGGTISDCIYQADETDIFNNLIDLIRNNMDKQGFPFNFLVKTVRNYFDIDINSPYYELSEYLKSIAPNNKYFARETLPYIIHEYINSSFEGDIKDFGVGYIYHWNPEFKKNEPNRANVDKSYFESVDWKKMDDNGDTILPISAIRGAGIAACTEYSILTQNCLAFLGFDTYLLGGTISVNGKPEEHNFNVRKIMGKDQYAIVDSAQCVASEIEIGTLSELNNIAVNRFLKDKTEVTYTSDIARQRKKSPLQQKEAELSSLEDKAKTISETEALINKSKGGKNIGE